MAKSKYERKAYHWLVEFDDKTLVQMKHEINALTDMYGPEARLVVHYDWDSIDTYIEVIPQKTKEEIAAEAAAEKAKAERKEKADRTRYETLKAKYGWE